MPARIEFTERDLKQLETLAGYGLSLELCAATLGVHHRTLEDHSKNPESPASVAIARGRARAQGKVSKTLFELACEGDINALKWWEVTRAKRAAHVEVTHKGDADAPLVVEVLIAPHADNPRKD